MGNSGQNGRTDLLAAYDGWHATRQVMSSLDGHPVDGPAPDQWHSSDAVAVDLLHDFASQIRGLDECGHGSAEVVYVDGKPQVQCEDCDTAWHADGNVVDPKAEFAELLRKARKAASGDSNDAEIEALQEALQYAAELLGVDVVEDDA